MLDNLLRFPFKQEALVANLVFSGLLTFFDYGGIISMPGTLITLIMFSHYCFDVGTAAAMGRDEAPVYRFNGFELQPFLFFLLASGLSTLAITYLGNVTGLLVVGLILPAVICSLLIDKEIYRALNPLNIISYIWQLKHNYAIPVASLFVMVGLHFIVPDNLWLWPKQFLLLSITLWCFYVIGLSLYHNRAAIKLDTPETSAEQTQRYERESTEKSFNHHSDEWHRLSEVKEFNKALSSIQTYQSEQDDPVRTADKIMTELCGWRNTRLAAKYFPVYLGIMGDAGKYGLIYHKFRQLVREHNDIVINSSEHKMRLKEFAHDLNDNDIYDLLDS
jgi:hypothetical protein